MTLQQELAGDLFTFVAAALLLIGFAILIAFVVSWIKADRIAATVEPIVRCHMRSAGNPPCSRPGVVWVIDQDMQAAKVCRAHRDEGLVLGWWATDTLYDQTLDRGQS